MTAINPILMIDGYKLDHRRHYPDGTTRVYSNWTPRGSRIPGVSEVVFFGLQYFLEHYMGRLFDEEFFDLPRGTVEARYARRINAYLGENTVGTKHIGELHELGFLPLRFCALREGTRCPLRVPMLTVENTHDDFAWLTNYVETIMSSVLWLPCTSATIAHRMRSMLNGWAVETGGDPNFVQWQGHDFSMRGMCGIESGALSGMGHLLSFTGTDTLPAIDFIEHYYHGDNMGILGCSIPATEHSVMSCRGPEGEVDTFTHLLNLYPKGPVSIVSDTWDLWHVIEGIMPALKPLIMRRDGKVVLRPDSGDPVKIVCGDPAASREVVRKGVIEALWDLFGGTKTPKMFRQLDPHIGAIYGDAVFHDRANAICEGLARKGFASTNIVFGVGSFTYQYNTRDTFGFAMKATWAKIDNKGLDIFKKPATDDGVKYSATGRLAVLRDPDVPAVLRVVERATPEQERDSLLEKVWENGKFHRHQSFAEVRKQLWPPS